MTDARERIADIIWSGWNHVDAEESDADLIADAILSALPSIVREMIKPLEWSQEKYKHTEWHSHPYKIKMHYADVFVVSGWVFGSNPYKSLEEAKKAANEHHKQQILKAMGMSE